MRKGSMTKEELDAYNQGLKDAYERFDNEYGHLIDRENPTKPIRIDGFEACMCRKCCGYIDSGTYCTHCGQRLKWDEDESKS